MDYSAIPQNIRDFLVDCIESVSQLEILLMIYRSNRHWTAKEISNELRSHPVTAQKQLEILLAKGTLAQASQEAFFYHPRSPEIHSTIESLHHLYQERPVAIITFIFDKPNDRLRGFADAFKFKKD